MELVKFKLLRPGSVLPKRGTPDSGALDIFAPVEGCILPGERQMVPTGLAHEVNGNWRIPLINVHDGDRMHEIAFKLQGVLIPRSGLASKKGIRLFFAPCLIDFDYRGEITVLIENQGDDVVYWKTGDRLCQIAYMPMYMGDVAAVEELTATVRGAGGFGSTGS